jgi:hypothetical protein
MFVIENTDIYISFKCWHNATYYIDNALNDGKKYQILALNE